MKRPLRLLLLALSGLAFSAQAQESPKPQLRGTPPSPLAPPSEPQPALENIDPMPLIPEDLEPAPKPEGRALTELKKSKPIQAEGELAARIRLREAKTRALHDASIQAEWTRAQNARTPHERREALKSYYTQLYAKIERLDGSLKKRVAILRDASIKKITQRNIEPSDPVERSIEEERERP